MRDYRTKFRAYRGEGGTINEIIRERLRLENDKYKADQLRPGLQEIVESNNIWTNQWNEADRGENRTMKNRYLPFGYKIADGKIVADSEQVEAVRRIFDAYTAGQTF